MAKSRRNQFAGIHPLWWFTVAVWAAISAVIMIALPLAGPLKVLMSIAIALILAVAADSRLNRASATRRRSRRSA